MASKKYTWRDGSRLGKFNAQKIGVELEKIRKEHEALTPEITVETARSKSSPLHGVFTWDDGKAAHEFRLIEARNLIRNIHVIVEEGPSVSQYVHVRTKEEGLPDRRYEPMDVVIQSVDSFQSALALLEEKLSGATRAVRELRDAAGQSKHKGAHAIIGIVMKALTTAEEAVKKLSKAA